MQNLVRQTQMTTRAGESQAAVAKVTARSSVADRPQVCSKRLTSVEVQLARVVNNENVAGRFIDQMQGAMRDGSADGIMGHRRLSAETIRRLQIRFGKP